jgi:hypothetical protein
VGVTDGVGVGVGVGVSVEIGVGVGVAVGKGVLVGLGSRVGLNSFSGVGFRSMTTSFSFRSLSPVFFSFLPVAREKNVIEERIMSSTTKRSITRIRICIRAAAAVGYFSTIVLST